MDDGIVRMFNSTLPTVTELAREDTVYIISKHSPVTKRVMVGGDGIIPASKMPSPVNLDETLNANKLSKIIRQAVDDSIKKNPSAGNTKAKRAKIWKDKIQKDKDKKIKVKSIKLTK